jgi:hypothetical protein
MRSSAASNRSAAASASSLSPDIPPASPQALTELKAGEALNVKQYPAVVIHGLTDARAVLALAMPVTLLSAPGAALYAGCGWWRALIDRARREHPEVPVDDILDCADASGLALGAIRTGQRRLILLPAAPGWHAVATIAASHGGEVLTSRPLSLDMAERGSRRRLHDWLHLRTAPGDSRPALR